MAKLIVAIMIFFIFINSDRIQSRGNGPAPQPESLTPQVSRRLPAALPSPLPPHSSPHLPALLRPAAGQGLATVPPPGQRYRTTLPPGRGVPGSAPSLVAGRRFLASRHRPPPPSGTQNPSRLARSL
jgi:hypothetical protein